MPRHTKKLPRKWEVFPGRNTFYCNGRIVMAQRAGLFYLCTCIIALTSGLFFAFDCPYLARSVSPAIPVVAGVLFVFVMANLFRTSFSDPGILPRATKDEAADIERQIEVQTVVGNGTAYRPPPRTKEIVIRNQTIKLKYCFTCKIFRPPRASHCSICDNCVDRFDHHCPWVGNCVGLRNYRYFYLFLVSLAIQCVLFFTCAVSHLVLVSREPGKNFLDAVKSNPSSVIVCVICFLSIWSVLGLAGFHSYLVTSNLTTNEDIKGSYSNKRSHGNYNPFHEGSGFLNCFNVLCTPLPPSLIDPGGYATEDFMSQRLSAVSTANSKKNSGGFGIDSNAAQLPSMSSPGVDSVSYNHGSGTVRPGQQDVMSRQASLHESDQHEALHQVAVGEPDPFVPGKMRLATTMPEINKHSTKSPPIENGRSENKIKIPVSQSEHALSQHNIGIHNEQVAAEDKVSKNSTRLDRPLDLDQTTMIGSALDLDSLSGDECREDIESRISTGAGSQVGLLKMSYTSA